MGDCIDSGWNEWSKYILITIEKLGNAVEDASKENAVLRVEMIDKLTDLKGKLYNELYTCSKEKTEYYSNIIKELEDIINKVSTRTLKLEEVSVEGVIEAAMDKRFIKFNEETIFPLRVKLTIVCVFAGALGGVALQLIPFLFNLTYWR